MTKPGQSNPTTDAALSRRTLGRLAGAGALSLLASQAEAARGKSSKGVVIGVQSYSLRDRPLDAAIEGMLAAGLKSCEMWQGHVEPGGRDLPREVLRRWRLEVPLRMFEGIRKRFDKAGIDLYAYNLSFRDDFSDEEIARGFEMAKALGVKALTASGTLSVVPRVAPLAKKYKLPVGMHNHSRIKENEYATPEDFAKAMDGPGREYIAINLDIGHFTAANFDAVDFLKKNHERIVTLHIKDRKRDQGDNVPFGEGDTPIKAVMTLLRDSKWAIPANIEYEYKGEDTVEELKRCRLHCEEALRA